MRRWLLLTGGFLAGTALLAVGSVMATGERQGARIDSLAQDCGETEFTDYLTVDDAVQGGADTPQEAVEKAYPNESADLRERKLSEKHVALEGYRQERDGKERRVVAFDVQELGDGWLVTKVQRVASCDVFTRTKS
jgi:hypothetical protein